MLDTGANPASVADALEHARKALDTLDECHWQAVAQPEPLRISGQISASFPHSPQKLTEIEPI